MNDPETAKTCSGTLSSATHAIAMAGPADSAIGREPELDPALASALADVEYSHDALERSLPRDAQLSFDDELSRASLRGETIRSTANTATVGIDSDDVHDPDPSESLKNLEEYCRLTIPKVRFDVTPIQLRDDIESRVNALSLYYAERSDLVNGMPFRAVTKIGSEAIKKEGVLDAQKFKELVDENPEAMFLELKNRTFLTIAYRSAK